MMSHSLSNHCAVSCIAWDPSENLKAAALLRKHGANALEGAPGLFSCPLEAVSTKQLQDEKHFWEEQGLPLQAMQALLFGRPELVLFGSEKERDALAAHLRTVFRVAQGLGVQTLIFGSPKNRQRNGLSEKDAFDIAANFFFQRAVEAYEYGCVLCLEANAAAYQCDFMTTHEAVTTLVRTVNHRGFGLQIDTGVMQMNAETPKELAAQWDAAHIIPQHIHFSMPFLEPLDTQAKNLFETMKTLLCQRGYTGIFSIEMKKTGAGLKALESALNIMQTG